MGLNDFKKNSAAFLDKLSDRISTMDKVQREQDPNEWFPKVNAAGEGYSVVRLLPAAEGEEYPFAHWHEHNFQGLNGKWYIERCPTSIQREDPVCQVNTKLWDTGIEANRDIVRKRSRVSKYVVNVYVVEDTLSPENVGTVKKFNFGKKIWDKIEAKMFPPEGQKRYNPFNPLEGMNLIINIKSPNKRRNYDSSEWQIVNDRVTYPLFTKADGTADEDRIEAVLKQCHRLLPYLDASNYKSYEDLKRNLERVLGTSLDVSSGGNNSAPATSEKATATQETKQETTTQTSTTKEETKTTAQTVVPPPSVVKEESVLNENNDDEMAFFQSILKQ